MCVSGGPPLSALENKIKTRKRAILSDSLLVDSVSQHPSGQKLKSGLWKTTPGVTKA
jgi:hypothetical protein